jgi:hypothetical protein
MLHDLFNDLSSKFCQQISMSKHKFFFFLGLCIWINTDLETAQSGYSSIRIHKVNGSKTDLFVIKLKKFTKNHNFTIFSCPGSGSGSRIPNPDPDQAHNLIEFGSNPDPRSTTLDFSLLDCPHTTISCSNVKKRKKKENKI